MYQLNNPEFTKIEMHHLSDIRVYLDNNWVTLRFAYTHQKWITLRLTW